MWPGKRNVSIWLLYNLTNDILFSMCGNRWLMTGIYTIEEYLLCDSLYKTCDDNALLGVAVGWCGVCVMMWKEVRKYGMPSCMAEMTGGMAAFFSSQNFLFASAAHRLPPTACWQARRRHWRASRCHYLSVSWVVGGNGRTLPRILPAHAG